jgi:hypothetical protein
MGATVVVKLKVGTRVFQNALEVEFDSGVLKVLVDPKSAVMFAVNQWTEVSVTENEE